MILHSAAGTGSSPTMDVKIQDSANNSQFADVSGYTFTRVIHTAASLQRLNVDTRKVRRYVQAVATIGGSTPVFTFDMVALGQKQSQ